MNFEDPPTHYHSSILTVIPEGTISCGNILFKTINATIRKEILKIIGQNDKRILLRQDYSAKLIKGHLRPIDIPAGPTSVKSEHYVRRKNNVDKALSRLRMDLERIFKTAFPAGTSWMRYSSKIDGWPLYCLPGLGCDGEFHS